MNDYVMVLRKGEGEEFREALLKVCKACFGLVKLIGLDYITQSGCGRCELLSFNRPCCPANTVA